MDTDRCSIRRMRVLGNIRLSNETDETTSPARQRAGLTSWADALGHTIVGWAADIDVSGAIPPGERPELGRWLGTDPPTEYDIIASTKIDRLSRDLGDFVNLIDWAADHGKYIVAYMDSVDTSTPTGELVAKVLAIFAEFERKTIAKRTLDSYELAVSEGRWHGGTVPYGYFPEKQPKGEGWKLAVDPESSETFREVVEWFLGGKSLTEIAFRLNEAGTLSPTEFYRKRSGKDLVGTKWSGTSVSVILRSRSPLGVVERNGEVMRGVDGLPVKRARAIISRSDWDLVQARLEQISIARPRSRDVSPLLQVAFCINCGNPEYRLRNKKKTKAGEKVNEYYRCRGWRDKLNNCPNSSLRAENLHRLVEKCLLDAIGDVEVLTEVYFPGNDRSKDLADASAALTDLLDKTAGKPKEVQKVYEAKIAALEALITSLSLLPALEARTEMVPSGATYRELWDASDAEERRALLLKAGVRIEAAPASGDWVSVGRFERPERYDEAVSLGVQEGIQYAFYLPKDLLSRTTGLSTVSR